MAIVTHASLPLLWANASPQGFIVLEGVNGAGKSALLSNLSQYLSEQKVSHRCTFEPGDSEPGKSLRRLLLESTNSPLQPMSELFLFCADRHEHVERVIKPALASRSLVLCDRYYYSTLAFQCYGRGLDRDFVDRANEQAISGVKPDVVLLLDLDEAEGLRRTKQRAGSSDSFESEELTFHKRIRQGFLEMAEQLPEPFVIIDAAQSVEEVYREAKEVIQKVLMSLKDRW